MAPALKMPLRLTMDEFRQNVAEARSSIQQATDFMVRQLEKTAAKSAVFDLPRLIQNNDQARQITQKTVQAISSDLGKIATLGIEKGAPLLIENSVRQTGALLSTVAVPATIGFGQAMLPLVARAAAIYAGWEAIKSAIGQARRELEQMLEVAQGAQAVQLTPLAFQSFLAPAKGDKDIERLLHESLASFYQNAKDVLDPNANPDALEQFKRKWSEIETTIRTIRFEMQATQGPQTFLQAAGNAAQVMSQRLLGVVQTINELLASGQRLQALDLIAKAFGQGLSDAVAQGRVQWSAVAASVENYAHGVRDSTSYSNELVGRTKELHDRLTDAWNTVNQNMRPAWEDLDRIALDIKAIWVGIVELMAKASGYIPGAGPQTSELEQKKAQLADLEATIAKVQAQIANPSWISSLLNTAPQLEQELDRLQTKAAGLRKEIAALSPPPQNAPGNNWQLGGAPKPTNIPQSQQSISTGSQSKGDFEREVDLLNRRAAAYESEADSVRESTEEKARAYATDQLIAAMNREGIEIDDRLADRIDAIADAYAKSAARAEAARGTFQAVNDAWRFFGDEAANALSNINAQTRGIDLLRSAVQDLSRELLRAALTGEGAFAKLLGFSSPTGGVGGLFGALAGLFRADGGPVSAGQSYIVGERGPEIFVPREPGTIVSNKAAFAAPMAMPAIAPASSGGVVYAPRYTIDARGSSMSEEQFRKILDQHGEQVKKDLRRELPARVAAINADPRAR